MPTYLEARTNAQKLRNANTVPPSQFKEGESVMSAHGTGIVLEQGHFNQGVWMYSYRIALDEPQGSGRVIEVMEWALVGAAK
jgi:hypothetical protein